jgi:hypothetical protein
MSNVQQIINEHTNKADHAEREWRATFTPAAFLLCNPNDDTFTVEEVAASEMDYSKYAGYMCVKIDKSDHKTWQAHQFQIGQILPQGKFVLNMRPRFRDAQMSKPNIDKGIHYAWQTLVNECLTWQEKDIAFQMERYEARQSRFENNNNTKQPMRVGKTQKARDKKEAGKKSTEAEKPAEKPASQSAEKPASQSAE